MLALAQVKHPEVSFHRADICCFDSNRQWDFITAWDCIWHVPLHQQEAVIRKLLGWLKPGGIFISTTGGVSKADERTNPCHGQPLYHAALGITPVLKIIASTNGELCHLAYGQQPEAGGHVCYIVKKR